jgi:hypothetical protein
MPVPTNRKATRGRSSITHVDLKNPTKRPAAERATQVNRAVSAGDHRGDRRDMSPTYTNNTKHASRGNTPRKDVSTRKR